MVLQLLARLLLLVVVVGAATALRALLVLLPLLVEGGLVLLLPLLLLHLAGATGTTVSMVARWRSGGPHMVVGLPLLPPLLLLLAGVLLLLPPLLLPPTAGMVVAFMETAGIITLAASLWAPGATPSGPGATAARMPGLLLASALGELLRLQVLLLAVRSEGPGTMRHLEHQQAGGLLNTVWFRPGPGCHGLAGSPCRCWLRATT